MDGCNPHTQPLPSPHPQSQPSSSSSSSVGTAPGSLAAGAHVGADEFFPVLVYVLLRANPRAHAKSSFFLQLSALYLRRHTSLHYLRHMSLFLQEVAKKLMGSC